MHIIKFHEYAICISQILSFYQVDRYANGEKTGKKKVKLLMSLLSVTVS